MVISDNGRQVFLDKLFSIQNECTNFKYLDNLLRVHRDVFQLPDT